MSVPPAALLWDVDGTMLDTTGLIASALDYIYQKYFARALPFHERRALIGIPLKRQIRVFGDLAAFGVDESEITADFIRYYEAHREEERVLGDVTALVIEGKRRGFPTALVTSKNREELANTLPRLGIADYVDFAVTADHVTRTKPEPEGILLALDRLAIPSEARPTAVFIGDTVHDMAAARAAGVRGIAVTWGAAPREILETQHPAAVCESSGALRSLLFSPDP